MIQCTVGNCELTDVWKLLNWEANWAKTFTQKKITKKYAFWRSVWLDVESLLFHGNENTVYFYITSCECIQR